MKTKDYLYLMLLSGLLFAGCNRVPEPPDKFGLPAFSVEGLVDNRQVKLVAGEDDFYMKTDFTRSADGLYEFTSDLKKDCPGCKTSFRIIIRDVDLSSPGTPVVIDKSVANKSYVFSGINDSAIVAYKLTLISTDAGSGSPTRFWEFSDGTTSSLENFVKIVRPGTYTNISYTLFYPNGCSSSLSYPLHFKQYSRDYQPDFSYTVEDPGGYGYNFTCTPNIYSDHPPANFQWDLGDGSGTDIDKSTRHTYSTPGLYTVTLQHISNGDTDMIRKNVPVKGYSGCRANFIAKMEPVLDPLNRSTIIVEWTDENGNVYSSAKATQDSKSKFDLDHAENYMLDKLGRKTQSFSVNMNCKVSDGTTTINLKNISGRFAVAYP